MGEEAQSRPDPLIGQTLAERYHLTHKIGEGGMGSVYEATHVVIGKSVAVKVLREKYVDRPNVAARLVQEARLASSIRNDHIIDIIDSGKTDDGRTFVVMELLEGESLAELLRREGALPEARLIEIAKQVAGALGAAHARGIVHRDIKPENVFLTRRPAGEPDFVKVVDFGISTTVRDSREGEELGGDVGRLTSTGMVLGTPFYMSPEQARGDEQIDHRIDIYALGVILYEGLTGEVPYRGGNYLGIISRVLNHDATRPRQLRPELRISEALERVVLKAMAKAREDRYQTMELLAADLDRVLAGDWVEAPPPLEAPKRPVPENRVWMFAAGAIVLIGGAALLWAGRAARPTPPVVEAPKPVPAAPPSKPEAPKLVVLRVATEPPGAKVLEGDHVFGVTPCDVLLPRAEASVHLTFSLDGYEPAAADVVPLSDYPVKVALTPRPKAVKPKRPAAAVEPSKPADEPPKPLNGETLPNPYKKNGLITP
jgi:serine/threonine-protein kinase